jgi:hypothetical protein
MKPSGSRAFLLWGFFDYFMDLFLREGEIKMIKVSWLPS